jgi:ABC-type iron transport system FetAB permease component
VRTEPDSLVVHHISCSLPNFYTLSFLLTSIVIIIIIIIIIIIHHQLGLDRHVAGYSNRPLQVLPSFLLPFVLHFIHILGALLLFILVTCRGQFASYLLSLSSTGNF